MEPLSTGVALDTMHDWYLPTFYVRALPARSRYGTIADRSGIGYTECLCATGSSSRSAGRSACVADSRSARPGCMAGPVCCGAYARARSTRRQHTHKKKAEKQTRQVVNSRQKTTPMNTARAWLARTYAFTDNATHLLSCPRAHL